jgi:hypothetical protein
MGGEIVRMNLKTRTKWEVYFRGVGGECKHQYEDRICGRALGLEFDKQVNTIGISRTKTNNFGKKSSAKKFSTGSR